jgi:hypothetical protein
MNLYLACNLLNFVFKTSNAIHVKLYILYVFDKNLGPPVWEPGPNLRENLPTLPKRPGRRLCELKI